MKKSMLFVFAIVAMLGFATVSLAADMPATDPIAKKPAKTTVKKAKKTKKSSAKSAATQSTSAAMPVETTVPATK